MIRRNVRKESPWNYTPLVSNLFEEGMEFEPHKFKVSRASHEKTINLLKNSYNPKLKLNISSLLPSEMWGWARVLSQSFGRLNEVMATKVNWQIYGYGNPDEELTAYSKVLNLENRRELPLVTIETIVSDSKNKILMKTEDECLMLHEVNRPVYNFSRENSELVKGLTQRKIIDRRDVQVYFRWDWKLEIWKNNIHTDEYARKFGFERGLPEFAVYMDWLFLSQFLQTQKSLGRMNIEVEKIKPFYEKDKLEIISLETEKSNEQEVCFLTKEGKLKLQSKILLSTKC